MPNKFRQNVVIDTNVLISAMISPDSIPNQVLHRALADYELCVSHETLGELLEVANRPKFAKYLQKTADKNHFIDVIIENAKVFDVVHEVNDCPDPKDNKFLALALSANAVYLVTGDKKDLLAMNPYHGVQIITARAFLDT